MQVRRQMRGDDKSVAKEWEGRNFISYWNLHDIWSQKEKEQEFRTSLKKKQKNKNKQTHEWWYKNNSLKNT